MTLRNSFSNMLKEDRKRRIWTFVMFCILCFLMTAAFELNLEGYLNSAREWNMMLSNIEDMTRAGMISTYLFFAGIGACLYGFQGFGWLTRKDQVDFYHSQPMKREKRFHIIYLNGLIMFEIPMLLHILACGILAGLRGYLSATVVQNLLFDVLAFTVAFLAMYHLVILAVMLTGNMIVSMMVSVILFVYAYVIRNVIYSFYYEYFDTYAGGYANAVAWIGYLSPVDQVYRVGNYIIRGNDQAALVNLLVLTIMAVAMYAAAFLLYKKRPSEAAGQAVAYPFAGDVIRFLIVLPAGMLFGIMFASMGVLSSVFWLYFGTVIGVVLTHGLMEVIFHFDIKAAVGKKKQLVLSSVLVLGIVSIFCFDIFGYDMYVPEADQVTELSYYIDIGEFSSNYCILNEDGVPVSVAMTQGLENDGTDTGISDTAIDKSEQAVISSGIYTKEYYAIDTGIYRDDYQMDVSTTTETQPILDLIHNYLSYDKDSESKDIGFLVAYKMKSGRTVYRDYRMSREFVEEYYGPIYETEQGRKVIYPYWNLTGEQVREVNVYVPFMSTKTVELSQEEMKELAECYKKDLEEQSIDELLDAGYIGQLTLVYDKIRGSSENSTENLGIYVADTHEHMLSFLEERDIFLTLPNENYTVTEAVVYNMYGGEDTVDHPFWQGKEEVQLTEEQLGELLPYMVPDEYSYFGYDTDYTVSAFVTVKNNTTGALKQVYYNVSRKHVPDYMKVEE